MYLNVYRAAEQQSAFIDISYFIFHYLIFYRHHHALPLLHGDPDLPAGLLHPLLAQSCRLLLHELFSVPRIHLFELLLSRLFLLLFALREALLALLRAQLLLLDAPQLVRIPMAFVFALGDSVKRATRSM